MKTAEQKRRDIAHVETLAHATARAFGYSSAEFMGKRKNQRIARTRQALAYVARQMWGFSFPTIAAGLHRSDHTTIMYAVRVVEKRRSTIGPTRHAVKRIQTLAKKIDFYSENVSVTLSGNASHPSGQCLTQKTKPIWSTGVVSSELFEQPITLPPGG
jgi:hypothetical protein